jgi:hypothetical protein
MALIKSIETVGGVPAVYWRIVRVDADVKARAIWFVLDGYVSQEARTTGLAAVLQKPFTVEIPEDTEPESFTRASLYGYAKGLEAFAGAVDA